MTKYYLWDGGDEAESDVDAVEASSAEDAIKAWCNDQEDLSDMFTIAVRAENGEREDFRVGVEIVTTYRITPRDHRGRR